MPIPLSPPLPLRVWLTFLFGAKRLTYAARIFVTLLALVLATTLTACGAPEAPDQNEDRQEEQKDDEKDEEPTLPGAPTVTAQAGHGSVTLTWGDVENAESYVVYFGTEEFDAETSDRIEPAVSPQVIDGLRNGVEYRFAVAARNEVGEGEWSETVVATPKAVIPAVPSNVIAEPGKDSVTVSWDPVATATSYALYYADEDFESVDQATRVDDVTSPHEVTSLSNEKHWYFAVAALNEAGEGEASATIRAVPIRPGPPAPTDVVATPLTHAFEVRWKSHESTEQNIVYVGTESPVTKENALVARVSTGATLIVSRVEGEPLEARRPYYVAVASENEEGVSLLSEEVVVVPLRNKPEAPTELHAEPWDGALTVSWVGDPTADFHHIRYLEGDRIPINRGEMLENVTSPYTITGLKNGTQYAIAVIADNLESGTARATTTGIPEVPPPVPESPVGLTAEPATGQVTLSWEPSEYADGYGIYYRQGVDPVPGAESVVVIPDVQPPFVVDLLQNDVTYHFAVTASNKVGESGLSDVVVATPVDLTPVIRSLTPLEGPLAGGEIVTLLGERLGTHDSRVFFGDVESTNVVVESPERITAQVPPAVASGWVPVRVENEHGERVREFGYVYSPFRLSTRVVHPLSIASPGTVVDGDFNGDGNPDLAIVSTRSGNASVQILFGDGSGGVLDTSTIPLSIPAPLGNTTAHDLVAADFDGDGHLDLATAHSDGANYEPFVQILFGDGRGGFTPMERIVGGRPTMLKLADFDADGRPELVVGHWQPVEPVETSVSVLSISRERTWTTVAEFELGIPVGSIFVGQMNAAEDDRLDIGVMPRVKDENVSAILLLQTDTPPGAPIAFEAPVEATGLTVRSVYPVHYAAVADVNGDGLDDVVIANQHVTLFTQQSDGTFSKSEIDGRSQRSWGQVEFVDLDGDGHWDLIARESSGSLLHLRYGEGEGAFSEPVAIGAGDGTRLIGIVDFNGDGLPDLVTADHQASAVTVAVVVLNPGETGRPFLPDTVLHEGVHSTHLRAVGVFMGPYVDDETTLALVGNFSNQHQIALSRYTPSGFARATFYPVQEAFSHAVSEDFDGDGVPDFLLAAQSSPRLMLVTEVGTSPVEVPFEVSGVVTSLASGDLNGDGFPDVVGAIPSQNEIVIGLNDESGQFAFESFPVGGKAVAVGDFDGDGDLDVAVVLDGSGNGLVFLWNVMNEGLAESFVVEETEESTGYGPVRLASADLDGDGTDELLVLARSNFSTRSGNLVVFRNTVGGTWTAQVLPADYSSSDLAVGDVDADGVLDVVVTHQRLGALGFYRGDGTGGLDPQVLVEAHGKPDKVTLFDLDGDGALEIHIAATGSFAPLVTVYPRAEEP